MIDETQDSLSATGPAASGPVAPGPAAPGPAPSAPAPSGPAAAPPTNGEIQETVDPFDYAETIVRDLALHVGTRLKDFRSDLAAMHSAVVQLPETMRINALGQSLQEVRDRVAHLTGVVSHNAIRPAEEIERISRQLTDLVQRLSTIEGWVATARRPGSPDDGQAPLPLPEGGLIGSNQFDRVIDQIHESIVRVVGAVREMQLDLRDIRADQQGQRKASMPVAMLAPPVSSPATAPVADTTAPASTAAATTAATPAAEPASLKAKSDLATLVFAVWPQLVRPSGAVALRHAVDQVLSQIEPRLDRLVRTPSVSKESGLVAVGTLARARGGNIVVLVATEDLVGQDWSLSDGAAEMTAEEPAPVLRVPCNRALLGAVALVEQTEPGAVVLPILIYGNGTIDRVPSRDEVLSQGQALGCAIAAGRLVPVAAQDLAGQPGLLRPGEALAALVGLLG